MKKKNKNIIKLFENSKLFTRKWDGMKRSRKENKKIILLK